MAFVTHRPKSGGWLVRWSEYAEEGGKRKRKMRSRFFADVETAAMYADSMNSIPAATAQRVLAARRPAAAPLADYLATLIASDSELRQASREVYEAGVRTHIAGTSLGATPVDLVAPAQLRQFWGALRCGPGARRNVYQLLAKAFNQAVLDGLIPSSPLRRSGVRRPSSERSGEIQLLQAEEALAAAASAPAYRLAILLAAYCGLRAGEVGGLRAQDVDLARGRISVAQAAVRTRGSRAVGPLKSRASQRVLAVAPSLVEELAEYMAGNPPAENGRILTTPGGGLLEHVRLNKAVHAAARRAGLPPVNFHALRHTCASLLIEAGHNAKQISAYMGHSSIRMTFDTYGHLFPGSDEGLAAGMEARRAAFRDRT